MHRLLRTIADVRANEVRLTLLMGGYYFVLLITYYLLKPARDSLFLVELGAEQLPLVFMIIAVVVAPVVRLHRWAAQQLSVRALMTAATGVLIGSLVLLWAVLGWQQRWLFYVLYVWVSIYGALVVSQFWLFANYVFTAAQARRLFVVLNVGAMLGAFFGGEVANALVDGLGMATRDLLLVTGGVLGASLVLVYAALRNAAEGAPANDTDTPDLDDEDESLTSVRLADTLRTIRSSWLLVFIVGIIALEMMTATFVDYQFKAITAEAFPTEEELTGFMATFYGRVSLLALVFQLFLLPRLLRNYGVGSALLLMPVGLFIGTIVLLIIPGLWAAVLLRGTDQSFEHSADKVGRELLFLPVPMDVKEQVKVFIDVVVDRGFRGLAGGMLMLLVAGFGVGVRGLAGLTLLFIVGWAVAALCARRSYTEAFEEALHRGELEMTTTWTRTTTVEDALAVLEQAIEDADDWRILYALQALESRSDARIVEAVRPLLRYPSRDVRRQAIETLDGQRDAPFLPEIEERLLDDDPAIQQAAFHYRFDQETSGAERLLDFLKSQGDTKLITATAACVIYFGTDEHHACLDRQTLEQVIREGGSELRAALAQVLADSDTTDRHELLIQLAHDDEAIVRRAAIQSMGRIADPNFLKPLIRLLGDDRVHVATWNALSRYGADALEALTEAFESDTIDERARRRIPRVLGTIPDPESVSHLVGRLQCSDPVLRYNVTAALLRLRSNPDAPDIPEAPVENALDEEITLFYQLTQAQHEITTHADAVDTDWDVPETAMGERPDLVELLQQRRGRSAERIFQLLGLRYAQDAVRRAYEAFQSDEESLRSLAAEWLDNVLDPSLRTTLRPIIDPPSLARQAEAAAEHLDERIGSTAEALALLLESPDPTMQTHALRLVPLDPRESLIERVRTAASDPHPQVRAVARQTLAHLTGTVA